METFMKTGRHPHIEYTRQDNASAALKPLPTVDHNRPHVFMDVSQRAGPSGRIVVELFEDMFPALCAAFRNRCHEVCRLCCMHLHLLLSGVRMHPALSIMST